MESLRVPLNLDLIICEPTKDFVGHISDVLLNCDEPAFIRMLKDSPNLDLIVFFEWSKSPKLNAHHRISSEECQGNTLC